MLKPFAQQVVLRKLDEAAEDKVNEVIGNELPYYIEKFMEDLEEEAEFYIEDAAEQITGDICNAIDIEGMMKETKINFCEKYRLKNYEDVIDEYNIEIDNSFVEEFIENYIGDGAM